MGISNHLRCLVGQGSCKVNLVRCTEYLAIADPGRPLGYQRQPTPYGANDRASAAANLGVEVSVAECLNNGEPGQGLCENRSGISKSHSPPCEALQRCKSTVGKSFDTQQLLNEAT